MPVPSLQFVTWSQTWESWLRAPPADYGRSYFFQEEICFLEAESLPLFNLSRFVSLSDEAGLISFSLCPQSDLKPEYHAYEANQNSVSHVHIKWTNVKVLAAHLNGRSALSVSAISFKWLEFTDHYILEVLMPAFRSSTAVSSLLLADFKTMYFPHKPHWSY